MLCAAAVVAVVAMAAAAAAVAVVSLVCRRASLCQRDECRVHIDQLRKPNGEATARGRDARRPRLWCVEAAGRSAARTRVVGGYARLRVVVACVQLLWHGTEEMWRGVVFCCAWAGEFSRVLL